MSTVVRGGVARVTCDEPGCSACAFDEEADDRWWDGIGHKCPQHQSALGMAQALEREQQRRAG